MNLKFILAGLLFIVSFTISAQSLAVYDSTTVSQSFGDIRDIRFNTQSHKNGASNQALKGVRMNILYKAIKGKLVADGVVAGAGIDSVQIFRDSVLIAYAGGVVVDRDTIRLPSTIPALGGDLTGTVGSAVVVDNSHNHNTTTITTDIVSSIDGVTNDGGNVDLIQGGILTITPNDGTNTVTFSVPAPDTTFSFGDLSGGTNSGTVRGLRGKAISAVAPSDGQIYVYDSGSMSWIARTLAAADTTLAGDVTGGLNSTIVGDNSHNHNATTLTTDVVSSINSVTNDGGNINIVAGNGLVTITSSDVSNTVTITPTTPDTTLLGDVTGGINTTVVGDNSHDHNATTITTNIVSSVGGVVNDGGNIGLVGDAYITVSPNNTTDTITLTLNTSAIKRPYKVYTALLTQTGTGDPTANVLENTLGGTVVWTRVTNGSYLATLASAFAINLTSVQVNYGAAIADANIIQAFTNTISTVRVYTRNSITGALSEMEGTLIFIEIRVYPAL